MKTYTIHYEDSYYDHWTGIKHHYSHTETVSSKKEYWDIMKLRYREKYGIYQTYSETLKTMTWYSYFGSEGFYKVHKNIETGKETRKHMRWTKCPKHLRTSEGWDLYMYFEG